MHVESPRSARTPKAVTFLRIPVLLAVGMMTMGSGMGNPGCGGSSVSVCEGGCAIAGTYTLQFADTSPPGDECEALGLGLPKGPLVVNLSGTYATATLDGASLSTYYYGEPSWELNLFGSQTLTETTWYNTVFTATVAAPAPQSDTDSSTIEGEYKLESYSSDKTASKCIIRRNFTATR
ncbi:hypothetical protein [Corallococcus carmarthensis]|uniref:Uncharacterized protein n=1 Tax=Corallococcus carmarthensis TaxID=2316728 RepID=A0A3A8KED8_9BACT|nr:hypothetical protein [Corallococcus carmarthensis]NOK17340.1 hypothetical protein [Corallococcus carmarthensis]RKH05677.1 hypothetical protein D7X32_07115 [Corallococcus carmarthensis]